MYFLVQANDVRRLLITQWESCKAQWVSIVFQLFRNLLLWMFSLFFWRRRRFGKNEKFNAKAARPEVAADTEKILWNSLLKKKRLPKISIK
jgi:hypothetical protein